MLYLDSHFPFSAIKAVTLDLLSVYTNIPLVSIGPYLIS